MSPWVKACRLRTLPLALSCTITGSCLAASDHKFRWPVFGLAALTTLLLQVLANMANDYGDFINGKDGPGRIGPKRMVQSGEISPGAMRAGLAAAAALCAVSGVALIVTATRGRCPALMAVFGALGLAAMAAAVKYTIGKAPYGYRGLGDISVFVFFGLVGVAGTYFLHAFSLRLNVLLPASAIGLLTVGVLNINNMRDYEADKSAGKRTVVVKLGPRKARYYHLALLAGAAVLSTAYALLYARSAGQWLFLLSFPPLFLNGKAVISYKDPSELSPELQRLSLTTLLFSATFGAGLLPWGFVR
ncbi:MAG: 1,4-dihydroxy-2-naphthoate polyprenyltransferase [Elusimicrobia bacterium]|nr:1,4-dihydroxy-2-naphthoate polyprenyltransferase [Elusimicrobiota bacterium]